MATTPARFVPLPPNGRMRAPTRWSNRFAGELTLKVRRQWSKSPPHTGATARTDRFSLFRSVRAGPSRRRLPLRSQEVACCVRRGADTPRSSDASRPRTADGLGWGRSWTIRPDGRRAEISAPVRDFPVPIARRCGASQLATPTRRRPHAPDTRPRRHRPLGRLRGGHAIGYPRFATEHDDRLGDVGRVDRVRSRPDLSKMADPMVDERDGADVAVAAEPVALDDGAGHRTRKLSA